MRLQVGLFLLALPAVLHAQGTTATISGTVTDATTAVISGAKVTATNLETNTSRNATSLVDGSYSIPFLPIGTYRVEIDAPGFKKFEQTGIRLEINRNARVDAVLQIGAVTDRVEVTADAGMV